MSKLYDKIQKVFAGWKDSTFVHLNQEQADRFIDYVVNESVLLQKIRVVRMNTPEKVIAKVWIGEKFLYPAGHAFNKRNTTEVGMDKIKLKSKRSRWKSTITDTELEDNIEWDEFKDHLMRMAAKACANQLEVAALYGRYIAEDEFSDKNCVDLNNQFNGFIERAKTVIDVANNSNYATKTIDVDKLVDLRLAIKSKYRAGLETIMGDDLVTRFSSKYSKSPNQVDPKWFMGKGFINVPLMSTESPIIADDATTTTLSAKNTQWDKTIKVVSAAWITEGTSITIAYWTPYEFSWIVESVSGNNITLEEAVPYEYEWTESVTVSSLTGAEILMADPRNLIQWIQRDIKIEFARDAENEQTNMYISTRTDFQIENDEAVAVMKWLSTAAA